MAIDPNRKTLRHFYCSDGLWQIFEQMSETMDRGVDDLVNDAMRAFAEQTQGSANFRALFVPVAVRALVALGDVDAAKAMIPTHSDARTARHRVSILTARAVVAEARNRCEEALEGYREAIELWRAHGFRLELGLTLTGEARCLLELGRDDEAEPLLREAREVLTPLRARPALAEVEALLGEEAAELG